MRIIILILLFSISVNAQDNYSRINGNKQYELSNHLGNVLTTVKDRKLVSNQNYTADVKTAQDYYPGGSIMPEIILEDSLYRYGYNQGSEKDDEIIGNGNNFTTKFREGDTRLLRWWSLDPERDKLPYQSPYSYMDANPVLLNDPDGDIAPWALGAVTGAVIDYGIQVAGNIKKDGLDVSNVYKDINITSIGFAALEGGLTAGASVGKTLVIGVTKSTLITGGVAVANNTIDVTLNRSGSDDLFSYEVQSNPYKIAANAAVDVIADKTVEGVAGKIFKAKPNIHYSKNDYYGHNTPLPNTQRKKKDGTPNMRFKDNIEIAKDVDKQSSRAKKLEFGVKSATYHYKDQVLKPTINQPLDDAWEKTKETVGDAWEKAGNAWDSFWED